MLYKNNKLYLSNICLLDVVKNYKIPTYVYSKNIVKTNLDRFKLAFKGKSKVFFALKSNNNKNLLSFLRTQNVGIDAVSAGEIKIALSNKFNPDKIIFSGIGKKLSEIKYAVQNNIHQINVESPQELERVGNICKKMKKSINIGFRFNPDVNPETHPYITTGFRENKFGMDSSFIPTITKILNNYKKELILRGVTLHIGSQLLDINVIGEAVHKTIPLFKYFRSLGYNMDRFNVGGGVGIPYKESDKKVDINAYGKMILNLLSKLDCDIHCEPGRYIVGNAGVLITQVQYIKKTPYKNFIIVDSGMHHFLRPALYNAYHDIKPLIKHQGEKLVYDIVGPICETSDFLGKMRLISKIEQGDFLAIGNVGAYGYVMMNNYNEHPQAKEIFKNL